MHQMLLPSDLTEVITVLDDVVDDFAGKTVLVAGGLGFLGRHLSAVIDELNRTRLSEPCTLLIVDNLITSGEAGRAFARERGQLFVERDISRPIEVDGPVDYVVHAAGLASPLYYRAYPLETLDVTIAGNRNLLGLAREKGARYTFFSSSEIYGDPDPRYVPTPETYRGNVASQGPRACYDEAKRVGETLCYIFHNYHGVQTTIVRPFNVYGPGMQQNDYRVLPNFASSIVAGRPLSLYGTGKQTRTFCYVTDALNGFVRTIARGIPGETYNIGCPEPEVSMKDLAGRIAKVLDREIDCEVISYPQSYPSDEPSRRCPDISKARAQLGYEPMVDLDTGLDRFLGWALRTYSSTAHDTGRPTSAQPQNQPAPTHVPVAPQPAE